LIFLLIAPFCGHINAGIEKWTKIIHKDQIPGAQEISLNARERVRQALLCRKTDKIPKALGSFDQSLAAIVSTRPENCFDLDVRFAEFDPPDNQDDFRRYMATLPEDIHVGSRARLRTYHEWQYHPEKGSTRPLSSIRSIADLADIVFLNL